MKAIEHFLEVLIFNSRWLLAPFYLGLVVGIVLLLVKFGQELIHTVPHIFTASESEVVLAVLALVDLSLVANLLLIVIFSGYENFVSKINTKGSARVDGASGFRWLEDQSDRLDRCHLCDRVAQGLCESRRPPEKRRRHTCHLVRG